MDYKDKVVLITGASSGIGKETAMEFARRGASTVLAARREEKLKQVESELAVFGTPVMTCRCDVTCKEQVEQMAKSVIERFGKIDILVNNAGAVTIGPVARLSTEKIRADMETNYFGMIHCIKSVLPSMLEKKSGRIVNVASVAASIGVPHIAPYCASKFAMRGFSEGLKYELDGTGIRVSVVSPGMVDTGFADLPASAPKYTPAPLHPRTVAEAIVKSAGSTKFEIIMPRAAGIAVWMKAVFPRLVEPMIAKMSKQLRDT